MIYETNYLMHFNPNHDKLGRFAKSNGTMYLKKGTKLNSVSGVESSKKYKNRRRWMYTYQKNNEWDNKVYKGPFSMYKMTTGVEKVMEHQYETIRDLKMPSRQLRVNEFKKILKSNATKREIYAYASHLALANVGSSTDVKKYENLANKRSINNDDDVETAYSVFSHMMEHNNLFSSTKKYSKKMSKKFDAMTDDNNKDKYNAAEDPIIIFKTNKALKEIGESRMLSPDEILKNFADVRDEMLKRGKTVML